MKLESRWLTLLLIVTLICLTAVLLYVRLGSTRPDPSPTTAEQYDAAMRAGSLAHLKGDLDEAWSHFSRAIAIDPTLSDAYVTRGVIHQQRAEWAAALADYRKAKDVDPKDVATWNNLAMLLAACPDGEIRDGAKAIQYARQACEMTEWHDPGRLHTYVVACCEAGDWETASSIVDGFLASAGEHPMRHQFQHLDGLIEKRQPYRFP